MAATGVARTIGQGKARVLGRTRLHFAQAILDQMGAPQTTANLEVILGQMTAEEPPGENAANNPLNLELAAASGFSGVGSWSIAPQIATFPSWKEGVEATAREYENVGGTYAFTEAKTVQEKADAISGWVGTDPAHEQEYASSIVSDIPAGDAARNANIQGSGAVTDVTNPAYHPLTSKQEALQSGLSAVVPGGSAIAGYISGIEGSLVRGLKIIIGILLLVGAIFVGIKM